MASCFLSRKNPLSLVTDKGFMFHFDSQTVRCLSMCTDFKRIRNWCTREKSSQDLQIDIHKHWNRWELKLYRFTSHLDWNSSHAFTSQPFSLLSLSFPLPLFFLFPLSCFLPLLSSLSFLSLFSLFLILHPFPHLIIPFPQFILFFSCIIFLFSSPFFFPFSYFLKFTMTSGQFGPLKSSGNSAQFPFPLIMLYCIYCRAQNVRIQRKWTVNTPLKVMAPTLILCAHISKLDKRKHLTPCLRWRVEQSCFI